MISLVKNSLLKLYGSVVETGFLRSRSGRALFETTYHVYKVLLEAGPIDRLRDFVQPGGWIVDIGANIGFFTCRFARWTSNGGRVLAVEPERSNFERLAARLKRGCLQDKVEMVHAAAAEFEGTTFLRINPYHPGDHKLAATGEAVPAVTIDGMLQRLGNPRISLIKIDVQGAEFRVLEGAAQTLARIRPCLFVEIDDASLRQAGTSASKVIDRLVELGYSIHELNRRGHSEALSPREPLDKLAQRGAYQDFLFLPAGTLNASPGP